jgi:hypothetical protein
MENTAKLFENTSRLEKDLLSALYKRSPSDKQVNQLRLSIRENYEKIILSDPAFASSKDVDQLLWKSVFYRPIEEYRKIIKKYHMAAFPQTATTTTSSTNASTAASSSQQQQQKIEKAKEKLRKTCRNFQSFLEESSKYYDSLFKKLKHLYDNFRNENNSKFAKIILNSLHKNLIIQGDLSRYSELYKEDPNKNWKTAQKHYLHALELMPNSGNPHNQLAVIATYQNDECEAIYRYFRSLAVSRPFISARENLTLLFEKNRNNFEMMASEMKQQKSRKYKNRGTSQNDSEILDIAVLEKKFLTEFIRLHGILFTRISMEKIPTIQKVALKDFEQLLIKQGEKWEDLMLKLTIMLVFIVEHSRLHPQPNVAVQPSATSANTYFQHSLSLALSFFSTLLRVSSEHNFCHLGSIVVFMKYLEKNRALLNEEVASNFLQSLVTFLQNLSKKNAYFKPTKVSTMQPENDTPLKEDTEILGFIYIEGFATQVYKSSKDSIELSEETILKLRLKRLSYIISQFLIDDSVSLYYDYANNSFTVEKVDSRTQQLATTGDYDENEQELEYQTEEQVEQDKEHHENQFISSSFGVVVEDDTVPLQEDDILFNEDDETIAQPFGVSTNSFVQNQARSVWQNSSPPNQHAVDNNILSRLTSNQANMHQHQHIYGALFGRTLFNQDSEPLPSLFQDSTWSTSPIDFLTAPLNDNGRTIDHPFQFQNAASSPFQSTISPQLVHQGINGAPSVTSSSPNNSNIIDAPFSWRNTSFYQQQQDQQQASFINITSNKNPFIP